MDVLPYLYEHALHPTLLVFLFVPSIRESFTWIHHLSPPIRSRLATAKDECCDSAKLNVEMTKANNGREFFRRLATDALLYL